MNEIKFPNQSKEEIDQISAILIKELTDKSELNIKRIILTLKTYIIRNRK